MSKRDQGRKAVETMLEYGMPLAAINEILSALPTHPFTNAAYERLLDEMAAKREVKP